MENPNYYAIIPAEVRYSKELSMFQKLLYAEITALTQKDGYCWASNKYFAELYELSERYISQSINELKDKGFLQVEIDKEKGNKRKIYIGQIRRVSEKSESSIGIEQKFHRYRTDVLDPYRTKVPHNNININNNNNNNVGEEKFEETLTKTNSSLKDFNEIEKLKISGDLENLKKPEATTKNNSLEYLRSILNKIENGKEPNIPNFVKNEEIGEWKKFLLYWTEPDKNGKIRASKEKTFEIRRRWISWMIRTNEYQKTKQIQIKQNLTW